MAFGYYVYTIGGRASPQLHDFVIAAGTRLIAELTHRQVRIQEILTMRPVPASRKPYLELGDAPIRFGQSQTCIYLLAQPMEFRLPEAHPARRMAALSDIRRRINEAPSGSHARPPTVGRCLRQASAPARHFEKAGFHPRTLQRLLRLEGTSFDAIRDDVRYVVARDLLALTPLSVLEIALLRSDRCSPRAPAHCRIRRASLTCTPGPFSAGFATKGRASRRSATASVLRPPATCWA